MKHRIYWVHLDGLASRVEAQALADRLRGQLGITSTSISLRQNAPGGRR